MELESPIKHRPMTRWRGARNPFAGTCALAAVACYKAAQHEAGLLKRGHRFALESRVSVNRWDAEPLVVALHHSPRELPTYKTIVYTHTYIHIHTHSCIYIYIYIYNWYVVRSLVILACWHRFQSHSATKYVRPGSRFQVFNLWDEAEETIYIVWAWADNTSCLRWCKLYITLYIHIYILQLYLYHHTTNVSLSTWMPRRPVESWRSCGPPRDAGGLPGRFFEVF